MGGAAPTIGCGDGAWEDEEACDDAGLLVLALHCAIATSQVAKSSFDRRSGGDDHVSSRKVGLILPAAPLPAMAIASGARGRGTTWLCCQ